MAALSGAGSQPDAGQIERLVLAAVPPESSTTSAIAERLGEWALGLAPGVAQGHGVRNDS